MDRRSEYKSVRFLSLVKGFVYAVVINAPVLTAGSALLAIHTSPYRLKTDMKNLGFDPFSFQFLFHLAQGGIGASLRVRTPVNQQYLH
jgi:hypothetical protein